MDRKIVWIVVAVLVIGLAAIFYARTPPTPVPVDLPEQEPTVAPEYQPPFGPEPDPEPPPIFLAEEPPEPLPPLDESDAEARTALADAAGPELVEQHLAQESPIRRLVATVDSLSRDPIWMRSRAIPAQEGSFLVEGENDRMQIAQENYDRYAPFVQLVEQTDPVRLAAAYQKYYPLLQQSYEELGYPGRQFHNRALEVIDHLLQTPVVEGPIRLEQPHVLYQFADPELEALSSGQKALIRIGPENARIVREKLIQFRAAIEALPPPEPD